MQANIQNVEFFHTISLMWKCRFVYGLCIKMIYKVWVQSSVLVQQGQRVDSGMWVSRSPWWLLSSTSSVCGASIWSIVCPFWNSYVSIFSLFFSFSQYSSLTLKSRAFQRGIRFVHITFKQVSKVCFSERHSEIRKINTERLIGLVQSG